MTHCRPSDRVHEKINENNVCFFGGKLCGTKS